MAGTKDKVSGSIKEGAGKLTGDRETEAEGKTEKAKGQVKDAAQDVKDAAKGVRRGMKEE
jgi:uncharacterized protein YjbJ (UPF0337 family)